MFYPNFDKTLEDALVCTLLEYIVSIDNHEEIVEVLTAFCNEKRIMSGVIVGIGAINRLTLRFFNPKTKAYEDKTFCEQMEISSLTANVSTEGEKHICICTSPPDGAIIQLLPDIC